MSDNRKWLTFPLIDVASFQNGHAFYKDGYSDDGLIAIDLYNVSEDGKLRLGPRDKRVSPELCEKYSRFILDRGDLVIVMTDMTQKMGILGKCAKIDKDNSYILNQRIGRIVPDEAQVLRDYLYYYINSPAFLRPLHQKAKGAVQKYVNTGDIKENVIAVPSFDVQRKIAGILSAYDDLIENNLRRIRLLEEMAQSLYREWFVRFRFPGHESTQMVDSPLGPIPEGWEVVPFTEIADVLSGGTPKTKVDEYWNGGIPFFTPKDAPGSFYVSDTEKTLTELGVSKCASQLYERDTVFITARGTVGKIAMPSRPMAMNQSCYALRSNASFSQHFLFLTTKQQVEYLKKNTGGATFDTIIVDTFRRMQVSRPSEDIVANFTEKVLPIFGAVENLLNRNQTLRQTRDLLLPKLLSGDSDS